MTSSGMWVFFGIGLAVACAACGSSSSGGNGGNGGSGGSGGSGGHTGSAPDCAKIIASDETTPVTVRFVNQTAADIYLKYTLAGGCETVPAVEMKDPDGQELGFYFTGPCNQTCENFLTGSACNTATKTCSAPVMRIAPQGVVSATWTGAVLEQRTAPAACLGLDANQEDTACWAEIAPKAFPLSLTATAGTAVSCAPACACTPDASGSCTISSAAHVEGTMINGTGSFASGATSVDIVFQ